MPPHRDPILQKCPSNATKNVGHPMVILWSSYPCSWAFMGRHVGAPILAEPILLSAVMFGWLEAKSAIYASIYTTAYSTMYGKTASHPPTQPRFTQESLGAPHCRASSAAVRTYGIENVPPKRHCWDFFICSRLATLR